VHHPFFINIIVSPSGLVGLIILQVGINFHTAKVPDFRLVKNEKIW